jgi:Family of unknown function (DUF5722)
MPHFVTRIVFLALCFTSAVAAGPGLRVAVTPEEIRFAWTATGGEVEIREIPLHTSSDPQRDGRVVWRGAAGTGAAGIARFDGARDRLHAKFALGADGEPQHVTDFSALTRRSHALGAVANKKGLNCVLGIEDAVALGCAQVNQNINLGALLDWQSAEPKMHFTFEGKRFGLHAPAVARLDAELGAAHAAGQRVTGILLFYANARTPRASPLLHPLTDPATVTAGPSAFNTATAEGMLTYRAMVHWLVERYTREDAAHGWLAGLVIGNEVQSHWTWYHLGLVESEVVLREYTAALRAADLVTRSLHTDFPIYVSLEHHWTLPASDDPRKGCTAVEVLEGVSERARRGGDFPWHLAFHPYPENLGNPRFWADKSAPLRFDAPRLTFRNLEVLPAFLAQPRFLIEGKPRRIALTEQGFHCPEGAEGEAVQAAAFALAWKKVQALPAIESFLYHRHVDHPHEHGLRCGVREHDGSANVNGVGRARKLWEVMQKAGTPGEDDAFAFALPIVGRSDWGNVVATRFDPPRVSQREPGWVVFDFVLHREEAQRDNVQAVELRRLGPPDEVQERALLQHPKPKGLGRLTWRVRIPDAGAERCLLVFEALLNHAQSRGAGFVVEIDGREIFSRELGGGERVPAEIDLAEWRGREVGVTFAVDAMADPAYDWATWVAPRIVRR